jgi:hypothetical protein
MTNTKYILTAILVLSLLSLAIIAGCNNSPQTLTFTQLIAGADRYNGQTVTLEAFYFSGFEISALAGALGPASSGPWRIVPSGPLIWVASGISQDLQNRLSGQSDAASGYTERFGKLKVSGKFETGGRYGQLDAYYYQIAITSVDLLEWSPPPAAANAAADTSIQESSAATSPTPIFFPVQLDRYSRQPYPTDLAKGRLTLEENYLCLSAFMDSGESAVLVWPPGFSFKLDNQVVTILNQTGQTVARVGDKIQVNGGLVTVSTVEKYIGAKLPEGCEEPFWLVSKVVP